MNGGRVPAATSVGRPDITRREAERAAAELFGVHGSFVELGSQQDRNYRFDAAAGPVVLKVANPAWSPRSLAAQGAALRHLAAAGLDVPEVLPALDGSEIAWLETRGERLALRLLTYLDGIPLNEADYLAPTVVRRLGMLAGLISRALAGFEHEGLEVPVQWDLRHAEGIVASFAVHVDDPDARVQVEQVSTEAVARLAPLRDALRLQPVHGDLTDDNVVCRRAPDGRLQPYGIIDFGDLMRSWLVGELAITCAATLAHMPRNPLGILPAVQAFDELVPLTDEEIAALWPLIGLRAAALAVSDAQQLAVDPGNVYTAERAHVGWHTLDGVGELGFAFAEAAFRDALGRPDRQRRLVVSTPLVPALRDRARLVDLSVTSAELDEGRFLARDCEHQVLGQASADGIAVTRYGEHRLTRSRPRSHHEQATFALCVELVARHGSGDRVPVAGHRRRGRGLEHRARARRRLAQDLGYRAGRRARQHARGGRCHRNAARRRPHAGPAVHGRGSHATRRSRRPRARRPGVACAPTPRRSSGSTSLRRGSIRSPCSSAATRPSRACRAATTRSRRRSSAASPSTSSTRRAAPTSTWSTTSRCSATRTRR